MSDNLYRINDVLTALAGELGVLFESEEAEDEALQNLTMAVAAEFGLDDDGEVV